jgi:large subunit ribosomal protein L4
LNRKVKQLARKSALSLRAKQNELLVLDTLAFDAPKTKAMVEVLNNLQVAGKKVLFIVDDANINARKSAANIQRVNVVNVNELNTYTIMNSNAIVFTESSVATLEATLK